MGEAMLCLGIDVGIDQIWQPSCDYFSVTVCRTPAGICDQEAYLSHDRLKAKTHLSNC